MARPQPNSKPTPKAALSAGKFREAADLYKDLLKREPRPEWKQALAYAGRAGQMAAKGMLQEAIALWRTRTRAQACGMPLLEGPYVDWLARAGALGSALPVLLAATHEGSPE